MSLGNAFKIKKEDFLVYQHNCITSLSQGDVQLSNSFEKIEKFKNDFIQNLEKMTLTTPIELSDCDPSVDSPLIDTYTSILELLNSNKDCKFLKKIEILDSEFLETGRGKSQSPGFFSTPRLTKILMLFANLYQRIELVQNLYFTHFLVLDSLRFLCPKKRKFRHPIDLQALQINFNIRPDLH